MLKESLIFLQFKASERVKYYSRKRSITLEFRFSFGAMTNTRGFAYLEDLKRLGDTITECFVGKFSSDYQQTYFLFVKCLQGCESS